MIRIVRTNSKNQDFVELVNLLDNDLALRDGKEHTFYNQFNKIDTIKHAIVVYKNELHIGCGAIKQFQSSSMEIKRMYVLPENRGNGIAQKIVSALEKWSSELGYDNCILETGKRQLEALALYEKCGNQIIPNCGQYRGIENSVCFEKLLN